MSIQTNSKALAIAAAVLMAGSAMVSAAPLSGVSSSAHRDSGSGLVVKVGSYGKRYASNKRYKRSRSRHTVDAPFTHVETDRGRVIVDAPFTYVKRTRRGVHVQAPFVDIYIPR